MLARLVRSVRRKPKAVRDQYAFSIAVCFTGVVAFFWITSLSSNISSVSETGSVESVNEEQGLLSDIVGDIREGFGEFGAISQSATSTIDENVSTGAVHSTSATTTASPVSPNVAPQPEVRIATFTATSASTTQ